MTEKLKIEFAKLFQNETLPTLYFAPGRINIIGEHIDYSGGKVFPTTINLGTYAAAIKREDNIIRMRSLNFPEIYESSIQENQSFKTEDKWANYPKAVFTMLKNANYKMDSGFDVLFYGNLPVGAGLSSSASIELATAVMLNDLFALNAPMLELVKLSQQAENQYMGLNSGIMDQFAIGFGKKHQAIYLNTDTLEYEYVPLKLQGHSIIIASTNKPRTLVDSKYNERFSECKQALAILQQKLKVDNLCQITPDEFEKNKYLIEDYTLSRRAWHVIYENQRTQLAVKFLEDHDLKAFGQLLSQSHLSLKRDYDVTGLELDTLVEAAWRQDGVIGARMTGAGFGGCTINFVKNGFEDNFMSKVSAQYKEITGLDADFYIVESSDGASKILD